MKTLTVVNILLTVILAYTILNCSRRIISTRYYCDLINRADSSFLEYRFAKSETDNMAISDGIIVHYNPEHVFFGFNDQIINLDRNRVIPKRVGRAKLFIRHPNPDSMRIVDTLIIEVKSIDGLLKVNEVFSN